MAEKIRRAIEDVCLEHEGATVRLSVSIGVASIIPQHRERFEALIKVADDNLYQAKESGRNCVICSVADSPRF